MQFGVNNLRNATLIKELPLTLERISKEGGELRVVFNTTLDFDFADTLNTTQESMILGAFNRYDQNTLANTLHPTELAGRHPGIIFASIHLCFIKTGLMTGLSGFNRYFTELMIFASQVTIEEGAMDQLWAASVDKSIMSIATTMSRQTIRVATLRQVRMQSWASSCISGLSKPCLTSESEQGLIFRS